MHLIRVFFVNLRMFLSFALVNQYFCGRWRDTSIENTGYIQERDVSG